MNFGNISFGQRLAAIGAIVLLASMTIVDWYDVVGTDVGGNAFKNPGFLGGLADVALIVACVIAVGAAILAATSRSLSLPVAMNALTCFSGAMAMVLVFGRMIFQPYNNSYIELNVWIAVGFFGAACIAYGGWLSMADEAAQGETPVAPGDSPTGGQPQS